MKCKMQKSKCKASLVTQTPFAFCIVHFELQAAR
jgi:hypothetical protein